MKILSLFDGISCARVAFERAGILVEAYYASEVDKYAMQISRKNYPDIVQIGDVKEVKNHWGFMDARPDIDLLIGGSPCQDLSIAKKNRKGLDGDRSGLFWEYVRILKEVKPKYFILENVNSMPKEARAIITEAMGVEPIMIDAALVSAQRRKRLFWTNIPNVTLPNDRGILLKDILETDYKNPESFDVYNDKVVPNNKAKTLGTNPQCRTATAGQLVMESGDQSVYQYRRTYWRETKGGKVPTLTANMGTGGNNVPYVTNPKLLNFKGDTEKCMTITATAYKQPPQVHNAPTGIRKLTPIECERLQSLPDGYTEGVSNTQRYKALGNAFNVDVVAYILSFIPNNKARLN
jgi:DNA (cytosine-5)-methyltransferase 3A